MLLNYFTHQGNIATNAIGFSIRILCAYISHSQQF